MTLVKELRELLEKGTVRESLDSTPISWFGEPTVTIIEEFGRIKDISDPDIAEINWDYWNSLIKRVKKDFPIVKETEIRFKENLDRHQKLVFYKKDDIIIIEETCLEDDGEFGNKDKEEDWKEPVTYSLLKVVVKES